MRHHLLLGTRARTVAKHALTTTGHNRHTHAYICTPYINVNRACATAHGGADAWLRGSEPCYRVRRCSPCDLLASTRLHQSLRLSAHAGQLMPRWQLSTHKVLQLSNSRACDLPPSPNKGRHKRVTSSKAREGGSISAGGRRPPSPV